MEKVGKVFCPHRGACLNESPCLLQNGVLVLGKSPSFSQYGILGLGENSAVVLFCVFLEIPPFFYGFLQILIFGDYSAICGGNGFNRKSNQ